MPETSPILRILVVDDNESWIQRIVNEITQVISTARITFASSPYDALRVVVAADATHDPFKVICLNVELDVQWREKTFENWTTLLTSLIQASGAPLEGVIVITSQTNVYIDKDLLVSTVHEDFGRAIKTRRIRAKEQLKPGDLSVLISNLYTEYHGLNTGPLLNLPDKMLLNQHLSRLSVFVDGTPEDRRSTLRNAGLQEYEPQNLAGKGPQAVDAIITNLNERSLTPIPSVGCPMGAWLMYVLGIHGVECARQVKEDIVSLISRYQLLSEAAEAQLRKII